MLFTCWAFARFALRACWLRRPPHPGRRGSTGAVGAAGMRLWGWRVCVRTTLLPLPRCRIRVDFTVNALRVCLLPRPDPTNDRKRSGLPILDAFVAPAGCSDLENLRPLTTQVTQCAYLNTTTQLYSTVRGLPLLQCEAMKGWPTLGNIIGHGSLGCRGMRLM